jgi:hypothetical protein
VMTSHVSKPSGLRASPLHLPRRHVKAAS